MQPDLHLTRRSSAKTSPAKVQLATRGNSLSVRTAVHHGKARQASPVRRVELFLS